MKCKELMSHLLSDTMPNWIKYHHEKDIRIVRKVYSIGDLRYADTCEQFSSTMSKTPLVKLKHHVVSSSNLTLSNSPMLTSAFGKLLARKLTNRSIRNIAKSTNDLSGHNDCCNCSMPMKNTISKDNIEFVGRIGNGKFGSVFKAFYRTKQSDLLTVAIKHIDAGLDYDEIAKNVSTFQDVKHLHIVQFIGILKDIDNSIMFISEYAHARSLFECIISTNAKYEYSIDTLLEYLKQIASAMSYLEKKSIVHQNLCCRSFLVFNKTLIKLAELGWSHWNLSSWKDKSKLPIAWMSPESIHSHRFSSASDVFSFGVSMWECFTYGQIPWQELTSDEIANVINAPNHQRLSRPAYATSELYQIMLQCWKYEPTERPTFSQLERALLDIEFRQVRWKENNNKSTDLPDGFLSVETCRRGPLIILDRCLHIPISSSTTSSLLQCVSVDGQIGFVYNSDVEPLHVISFPKQTIVPATYSASSTMNYIFHRKTGIKKNSTKTKCKQISKDMISAPQTNNVHTCTDRITEDTVDPENFEKTNCTNESVHTAIEQKINHETMPSLLDEVMQAFTEIYAEKDPTCLSEENLQIQSLSSQSSLNNPSSTNMQLHPVDQIEDSSNFLSTVTSILSELKLVESHETASSFINDYEEHTKNDDDLNKHEQRNYNLLSNRYTNNSSSSSSTNDERSSSSSFNHEKSDTHSHYSSLSIDNDDNHSVLSLNSQASSTHKNRSEHSVTGQPLPPPPDLSSLGSKLTTATMKHLFELPPSATTTKYRRKSMNDD